jgi:hypothetical protein
MFLRDVPCWPGRCSATNRGVEKIKWGLGRGKKALSDDVCCVKVRGWEGTRSRK